MPKQIKYEYEITLSSPQELEQEKLNKMGEEGWELIAVFPTGFNIREYWKREIKNIPQKIKDQK